MIMLNYLSIHLNHNISHLFKTIDLRHYLFILILGYLITIKAPLLKYSALSYCSDTRARGNGCEWLWTNWE